ncbi:TolC family protein [Daejeonella lutea]|uniref:Outer membrane protein TolC n=1 Tax=Daejeonella lutea TaxID=572036 RepID=A0A1T5ADH9_9SPHI|nr:TolC family protein [Daejeonella lutea]SKB32980.1 Outer membrane protein TolC [Daejeonella lutea]
MKKTTFYLLALLTFSFLTVHLYAQRTDENHPTSLTLKECINFALKNQPLIQQSVIDEEIAERDIDIALSGIYPQVSGQANLSRYLKQPVSLLNGQPVIFQPKNNSNFLIQADQTLFSNDLLFAAKGAKFTRLNSQQKTESNKINTVVAVSKAFYDILTSQEQLKILNENIARVEKQFKDSYAQYDAGLVDKTDYKRASISLNNSRADLKRINESLTFKYAYLKQLMGLGSDDKVNLNYSGTILETELLLDTTQALLYENRIEYKQLLTQKQIQDLNIQFHKYDFLPSLSAFVNYNNIYQNNSFGDLYNKDFPSSQTGLRLSLPVFQGGRRIQNLKRAILQDKRLDLDIVQTKNVINTEYQQALASYKTNLNDWKTYRDNVDLSRDVYNTIKLQYNEGIKTYLELLIAESDLRSSQLNYLNSLFSLLASKLDVQQAQGIININQ